MKYIALRVNRMSPMIRLLDPASSLLFGQICKAGWLYLDLVRQLDVGETADDQQRLAGVEAAVRNLAIECQRFYAHAVGSSVLTLTQDAQVALAQMLAYDPTRVATLNVESTVLRIFRGARIK